MENKLMPKLRFPGFEGEWDEFMFKNLYEFKSTNSLSRDKLNYDTPNVKNIHYGDIHVRFKSLFDVTKELVPYINLDVNINKISDENFIKEGDVIIADASENYDDIGKAIEIININKDKVVSGLHTFLARKITDVNYIGFMTYVFKSKKYRHQIYKIAQGTKVLSLSSNRVNSLKFRIPSLPEQQKIADYLSTIDKKITLLEEKKEELSRYKKAMMQKLFSQEIRFKDDNGNDFPKWEEKRLVDVASFTITKNRINLVLPVLTNSAEFGVINQEDFFDNQIANDKSLDTYIVLDKYEFVYNPRISKHAPYGPINMNRLTKGLLSPLYSVFKINEDLMSLDYVDYYFKTSKWYKYMAISGNQGARSDRMAVSKDTLKNIPISKPSLPEQQKIADFLSAIDNSIDKVKEQIEQTQAFKKAMLQQLFV